MKYFLPLGLFFAVLVVATATVIVTSMNCKTKYNTLVNNYEAMRVKEKAFHDELWKSIAATAAVDVKNDSMQMRLFDAWENAISQTATNVSSQTGFMPLLFQQAGISNDNTIKIKLSQLIDDKNSEFTSRRNDIAAACLELNNFVENEWNRLFLPKSAKKVECAIITSSRSNAASETGVDDAGGSVY